MWFHHKISWKLYPYTGMAGLPLEVVPPPQSEISKMWLRTTSDLPTSSLLPSSRHLAILPAVLTAKLPGFAPLWGLSWCKLLLFYRNTPWLPFKINLSCRIPHPTLFLISLNLKCFFSKTQPGFWAQKACADHGKAEVLHVLSLKSSVNVSSWPVWHLLSQCLSALQSQGSVHVQPRRWKGDMPLDKKKKNSV